MYNRMQGCRLYSSRYTTPWRRKRRAIVTYPAHGTPERKHRSNFLKISADNIYPFRLGERRVNEAGNKRRQITEREGASSLWLLARIDCAADTSEVASFSLVLLHGSRGSHALWVTSSMGR